MSKNDNDANLTTISKQKKISFFSAILVVMGSSIGAGIFFKSKSVLDNSQNSLVLAIFCWIIAAFSVVAMALALVEVSSARNDNLSLLGWTKVFNSRKTFKASKNFMFYIYLPLTYFFMPLYVIMSLQDGIGALISKDANLGTSVDWLIWSIIGMIMSGYFIFVSGFSSKAGNIQNKIITYIKFLPLALVTIIGFVLVGLNAGGWNEVSVSTHRPTFPSKDQTNNVASTLANGGSLISFAPGLGMFMAVSAIFFAYDGFYVAAGIQTEMAEPKKTPMAILFGLLANTVIYLIIAISMSINGGSFSHMREFMEKEWQDSGRILFGIINIMIAIGVMGIINGFAMWAPRFVENLIQEGELPFSIKYKNKLNSHKPKIGIMYSIVITIPIYILFTLIGSLAYIDNMGYGESYGSGMAKLYSFADLMGTWTALFTFGFITIAIYGCLKNRKTKIIHTEEKKYFKPMAIISIIIITLALSVSVLIPIFDFALISQLDKKQIDLFNDKVGLDYARNYVDIVVSRTMLIISLLLFIGLSYGPTIVEDKINIKKFGSIEKYEQWQKENFIVS